MSGSSKPPENFGLVDAPAQPSAVRALLGLCYRIGVLTGFRHVADRFWLDRTGGARLGIRRKQAPCFIILTYHRVLPSVDPFGIDTVTSTVFRDQMRCLAKHFTVLTIEEIAARLGQGQPLPPNCIAVTFDDGYADNYHHAYPILKALGIPATFYLATGCIGTGHVLWFDQVMKAFERSSHTAVSLPYAKDPVALASQRERSTAGFRTLFWLRSLPTEQRDTSMREVFGRLGVVPPAHDPVLMMSWDQVRRMAADGYQFGSHTVSHPILSQLSLAEVSREVSESKRTIEAATGRPVTTFAYPSGRAQDYSADVIAILKKAGFRAAVTNATFTVNSTGEDPYRLNRLRPWEQDMASFLLKLCWYKFQDSGRRHSVEQTAATRSSDRQQALSS